VALPIGDKEVTQTYDASGSVVTQLDANSNAMRIAYDGQGGATIVPLVRAYLNTGNSMSELLLQKKPLVSLICNTETAETADSKSLI